MAMREARCNNCGSIININPEKENNCIFCWANIENDLAINLIEDANGYEFPNAHFEEPTDEVKATVLGMYGHHVPRYAPKKTKSSQPVPKQKQPAKVSAADKVKELNKDVSLPEIKVNKKVLGLTLTALAVIIVLAFAVSIPLRSSHTERMKMREAFLEYPNITDVTIRGFNSQELIAISKNDISENDAKQLFEFYNSVYEKQMGKANNSLTLRLYGENKVYKTENKDNQVVSTPLN